MRKLIRRAVAPLLAAGIAGVCASGCSLGDDGAADKAGGSDAPVVLRLAYGYKPAEGQPDEPMVRYFASRVETLSDGELSVRVVFNAAGQESPGVEERVARMVRSGRFDLGWVATRAWDELGVKSFQALQAPFLVTDSGLLTRVVTGPMAGEMLRGLRRTRLTGLAVVPDLLRHPVGRTHALASTGDFAGARIHTIPSHATDALLSALGATPVHVGDPALEDELSRGSIDGEEVAIPRARGGWTVTANVVFFGRANSVFANPAVLARLSEEQRAVLRTAARETARHVAAGLPSERELVRAHCSAGPVAFATPRQLTGLRRAARPVYDQLERDPQTRSFIARIRTLKHSLPRHPAAEPRPCKEVEAAPATHTARSPSDFDGTYRWRLTAEGARASGTPNDPDIGSVNTMTLRDGRWLLGTSEHYSGTFEVNGNRLSFDWPSEGTVLTMTFKRDKSGSLDLEPVPPMDPGDQFVWASARWRRVGPPVRTIP
jgi:TRAP-type C4-dicarboxylate transport system substrate-binding protein